MNPLSLPDGDRDTLLQYHRRQLNRAMVEQAHELDRNGDQNVLAVLTARIAGHIAVLDHLEPVLVCAGPDPAAVEKLRSALDAVGVYSAPIMPAPQPTRAVAEILAWLDDGPADWPWTAQDIAAMIRDGCPDWQSPEGGAPHRDVKQVVEWLEGRPETSHHVAAAALRERFNMPPLDPYAGLVPGDICNSGGSLLSGERRPVMSGLVWVRDEQASRAAPFGWRRTGEVGPNGCHMVRR